MKLSVIVGMFLQWYHSDIIPRILRNLIVPPAFRLGFTQTFKPAANKCNMCDLSNYGTCFLILFAFSTRSCLVSMSTQIKSNKKSTVSKTQQCGTKVINEEKKTVWEKRLSLCPLWPMIDFDFFFDFRSFFFHMTISNRYRYHQSFFSPCRKQLES